MLKKKKDKVNEIAEPQKIYSIIRCLIDKQHTF